MLLIKKLWRRVGGEDKRENLSSNELIRVKLQITMHLLWATLKNTQELMTRSMQLPY